MPTRTSIPRISTCRAGVLPAFLAASCLLLAMPAAAQTADSSAFGESTQVNVLPLLGGGVQVTSGPLPQVSGSAPAAYTKSGNVASAAASTALTGSILQTGIINVAASSEMPGGVRTHGDAGTNAVALALGQVLPLLTLKADLIQSAATVDGTCGSGLTATGSADLINAVAGGSLGLGLKVASHPGPNTVLLDVSGVKIVLNEQLATGDGTTSRGLTVNAVHVYLQNAVLSGLGVLNGDVVISRSQAHLQCAASPPVIPKPDVADAAACRIDAAPAATLLIPYFAVDLDHPQGVTTIFSVTNALAQPQLAHVVLWTDWAVPTLTFDLYLTGYDVESVDLRDVLGRGLVPGTGAAVSHQGDISEANVAFAGCGAGAAKALPLWMRKHLRAEHTGRRSASTGACAGSLQADAGVAAGYITIDTVRACTSASPADPGYFADGGGGIATNQNALLGEYFIVDPSANQIDADLAVHLRADAKNFGPGRYTFYSRYSGGADNRQPLGQAYAVSYTDAAPFPDGTQLIVWRDTKSPDKAAKSCGAEPSWMPLAQSGVLAFDSSENSALLPVEARPFPLATQLVKVGGSTLPALYHSGWLFLDLGHDATALFGQRAQAWVTVRHRSLGHFMMSTRAFRLDDLCGAQ